MISLSVVIQAVVDILILVVILYYLFERKNRKKEEQNAEQRKNELKEVAESLDHLIEESGRASVNISDKALEAERKARELIDQLEQKQEELQKEAEKTEALIIKLKDQQEPAPQKEAPDKYKEAARLAKTGLNVKEISKQLDLPRGEVELILDLPPKNQQRNR